MRNVAVAALWQVGFGGRQVAAALGLTANYVATLSRPWRAAGESRLAGVIAGC